MVFREGQSSNALSFTRLIDIFGFDEDFGDFDLPLGISRVEEDDDDRPATEEEMDELFSFEDDASHQSISPDTV